jgi:short subunit dehydrogenase-like uncharacterized protein
MTTARSDRTHDVVLWGATGYTGRLVAEYLARARPPELRWALGGRDRGRLERVRADLAAIDPRCAELPIVLGDAGEPASLDALASSTRVVCTTVGPYAKYGDELVAACVREGTDYCDLTGEVPWMRRTIDRFHALARESGARIVHTCGFDSIPSDLGVLLLQEYARARHGAPCARVSAYFGESKGGISGGTVASMLHGLDEMKRDPGVRRIFGNPYALDPDPQRRGPDARDRMSVAFDERIGRWTAPFLMARINTRVVRRTNALLGYPWGEQFRYEEVASTGTGARGLLRALAWGGGLAAFAGAVSVPVLRRILEARVLPKPGEGPSPEVREAGYFVMRMVGERDGLTVSARISDRRDPGYGSTAVMLAQSALCLAKDGITSPGGVLTPAACMGMRLIERLREAGLVFEAMDGPPRD